MTKVDYMKVIGVLSKTLQLETLNLQYADKSAERLDVTMGGTAKQEKTFRLAMKDYTLELTFPKTHIEVRAFDKWISAFEYELEQAFSRNVSVQINHDAEHYTLKMSF